MGRPKLNRPRIHARPTMEAFKLLEGDARSKGYLVFKGTQRQSVAWGEYLTAVAMAIVSGNCKVIAKENEVGP